MYILHILFFKIQKILNHKLRQTPLLTCYMCKIYITFTSYKISNNNEPFAIITR